MAMNGEGGIGEEAKLGQRLQAARRAAGLTQQELCQKAHLSYSTLAKIERGAIKAPSIFTIQNIATALGTSLDQLLGTASPAPSLAKRQSKSGIRFVYFDINGCLVHFFQGAFTELAGITGVSADVIETAFWHYNDAICRGEMTLEEFDQVVAGRLGVEPFKWQDYYFRAIQPVEGMQELVTWAAENYQVGLLTNIMPGFVTAMRAQHLLPAVTYDVIVDSSEVGAIKPEDEIYQIALDRARCAPEEILLIDDSRPNLMAAEKHGWHVLWFDSYRPAEAIERIKSALELA